MVGEEGPGQNKSSKKKEKSALKRIYLVSESFFLNKKKKKRELNKGDVALDWRRKWKLTAVFLPGESQGRRSLVGCHLWGNTEADTTEAT